MKKYLRLDEVAAMFSVTPRTVRNWYDSGKTCLIAWKPPTTRGGLRFTVESVTRFEESGRIDDDSMK